jgi:hypothetical protein
VAIELTKGDPLSAISNDKPVEKEAMAQDD